MKKIIAVLIALVFLLPITAVAKDKSREYHGDKYKVYQNKHPRAHKSDRHKPVHPYFKRGHKYPNYYRHHYTWREWYGGARFHYPNGIYQRHKASGVMLFSYCDGPVCFSFSLGD